MTVLVNTEGAAAGIAVTSAGQRLATLEADTQAIYGQDIDIAPESPDGQYLGIFSEVASDTDELAAAVFASRDPARATGAQLSRIAGLNGLARKPSVASSATVTLTGAVGTVIPAGSLVASSSTPPTVWSTATDIVIPAGGSIDVFATATTPGPVLAPGGTLTSIKSIIAGWASCTNASPATPGSLAETDGALRLRRLRSTALAAKGTGDSLFAGLTQLPGVIDAVAFENATDVTNALGDPPHSQHVVVQGGDPAAIAAMIWLKRSPGAQMVGAVTGTIVDAQGRQQVVRWDVPVEVPIYVVIHLSTLPADPDAVAAIATQLVADGSAAGRIGAPVIWSSLFASVLAVIGSIQNGPTISSITLGTAPGPTLQSNVVVGATAVASWDLANIVIASP